MAKTTVYGPYYKPKRRGSKKWELIVIADGVRIVKYFEDETEAKAEGDRTLGLQSAILGEYVGYREVSARWI